MGQAPESQFGVLDPSFGGSDRGFEPTISCVLPWQGKDPRASELIAGLLARWRQGFEVVHSSEPRTNDAESMTTRRAQRLHASSGPGFTTDDLARVRTGYRALLIDRSALQYFASPQARASRPSPRQPQRTLQVVAVPTPPLLAGEASLCRPRQQRVRHGSEASHRRSARSDPFARWLARVVFLRSGGRGAGRTRQRPGAANQPPRLRRVPVSASQPSHMPEARPRNACHRPATAACACAAAFSPLPAMAVTADPVSVAFALPTLAQLEEAGAVIGEIRIATHNRHLARATLR